MACSIGRSPNRPYSDWLEDAGITLSAQAVKDGLLPDEMVPGADFFFCGRNLKPEFMPTCACGTFADYLCDYPMAGGKTCDAPLCEEHRHPIKSEVDFCLIHFAEFRGKSGRTTLGEWPPKRCV